MRISKIIHLSIFIILTITSCQNTKKKSKNTEIIKNSNVVHKDVYFDYTYTKLNNIYADTIKYNFSDTNYKDSFILHLNSGNIEKSKATFIIKSFENHIIYEKKFFVSDLVNGYDLFNIKTHEQMKNYIINKAKSFLNIDNFSFPNTLEKFNSILFQSNKEDFEDYDTYIQCKKNNRPIFSYGLNEENISFIAYSKEHKKVIEILYCC